MKQSGQSQLRRLKRAIGRTGLRVAEALYRMVDGYLSPASPPPLTEENTHKILVVDLLRIGDTVVATPAIHAIKDAFPNAHLTVMVHPMIQPLLVDDPMIDELILPSLLRPHNRGFDLAVVLDMSLRGNFIAWLSRAPIRVGYDSFGRGFMLTERVPAPPYWNTATWDYARDEKVRHQVDSWLDLVERIGITPRDRHPRLFVRDAARQRVQEFLEESKVNANALKIAIHPGSNPSYQWRPERFAKVADLLRAQHGASIFVTGSRADSALANQILSHITTRATPATGLGGLDVMAALLSEMDLVVSVDTSATHIASAVETPVVALFGPGDPRIWRPYGSGHIVVRSESSECLGCKRASCFREAHFCMDGITVEQVMAAASPIIRSVRPKRAAE